MNTVVTVAIMIDAWSNDYFSEYSRAFRQLCTQGLQGILVPTFGFEPDSAYFAGLYPEECDGGAHYWYDPQGSPFGFTKFYSAWFDRLPELMELVLRRLTRRIAQKRISNSSMRYSASTARIPFRFLPYFGPVMKRMQFEPGFVLGTTIFDVLREEGLAWFYHGSPLHRVDLQSVLRHIERDLWSPCTFAFLHIGDLDGVGHKFGPDSIECRETVQKVEDCIYRIRQIVSERFDEANFVIFGDHGMMQVQRHLNVWSRLERLDLEVGRDYLFFLDSTMARFWFFNERANKEISRLLAALESISIIE